MTQISQSSLVRKMVDKLRSVLKKKKLILLTLLVLLSIVAAFIYIRLTDTKSVDLNALDLIVSEFPATLTEGIEQREMIWQLQEDKLERGVREVTWANEDESLLSSPFIYMEAIDLSNGLEAEAFYLQYVIRTQGSNNWPNSYSPEARYPSDTHEFQLMNNNFVACEMGGCQRWLYIGRYGKSVISIIYMAPASAISQGTFATIVKSIVEPITSE
jgi:hypothetical protein